ncbi:phosphoribosylglycinamide formyltransferase [Urechidicola vernalis]|uniref:Phosphoribosylglycinamide formyltransferase n=1 Tax=Urechidicola vernalis TaxID=3075600 RepID=A0ABU2Y6K8_9FLAO|nr:phosphoribosylglycinamide formyltransferase [Urechidicola sp. P050]MDT0553322.1 phosphoribosylglycinamide formyltransferase [Urechidicola sp. P050]
MKRIVIFASGSGSNAENIFEYFKTSNAVKIVSFITNNPNAKVLDRAKRLGVESLVFNRSEFNDETLLGKYLQENADFIVLAGFLWRIPEYMVKAFSNKMINIHPALLPKYGGKGMYGMHVHNAVVENKENETGITIHFVNENYDEGAIIFQANTNVLPSDSPDDVAGKIHALEYEHFPKIIEQVLLKHG